MKSILKKVAGAAVLALAVAGFYGCSQPEDETHEHTFAEAWTKTATKHKETYNCCGAVKTAETNHTFGAWASNNDDLKTKSHSCSGCKYVETAPDYSRCVVGDFILKNGSILSKGETPASGTVAAVIVRAAADGKPTLGVGIVHSKLAWCKADASAYNKEITALEGDKESNYYHGFEDGSNSWELLVAACDDLKNATAETIETVAENYLAFNYCRKYGTTNGLTGDLANGWYLPTIVELKTIHQNKDVVDASLTKAGGSNFGDRYFLSCCQFPDSDYYIVNAVGLQFDSGYSNNGKKTDGGFICSVKAFN